MTSFWRAVIFILTVIVIFGGTILAIFYARGFRVDLGNKSIGSTGLLVATSVPDGAQVWVNGILRTATNATVALTPGEINVEIKKDGFSTWKKQITLKAEEVVKTDATLFPVLPNLRPMTFSGAVNPLLSPLGDRLVYATPLSDQPLASPSPQPKGVGASGLTATKSATGITGVSNQSLSNQLPTKTGLWVMDLIDMPLGFSREPRQIARSTAALDWSKALTFWSPDERQILAVFLTKPPVSNKYIRQSDLKNAYLLDPSKLNTTADLIDVSKDISIIASQWAAQRKQTASTQMGKLPAQVRGILAGSISSFKFSPDETKIVYQATVSATLPDGLLPTLPGSNSQPQQRTIHAGGIYVYDLKEDRNFWVKDLPILPSVQKGVIELDGTELFDTPSVISWFPTSRHLLWLNGDKITVIEYDGTNSADVYTGPFIGNVVFPTSNGSKMIILTNLGSATQVGNLYSLILR